MREAMMLIFLGVTEYNDLCCTHFPDYDMAF